MYSHKKDAKHGLLKYKNERYAGSVVSILIQNMSVCKNQDWNFPSLYE